jgi:MFS family permease
MNSDFKVGKSSTSDKSSKICDSTINTSKISKKPRTLSEVMAEKKFNDKGFKTNPNNSKVGVKSKFDSAADSNADEPLYKKKERSVNYSVKDGLFTSIKSGLTDNFVMPFAIALNATSGMLAAISSVPQLVASFFQLFAQSSLKFFKTRGRLIFVSAFIQAFMWLPLLLIPLLVHHNVQLSFILILLFVTLETTIGTFQGPIYNSILGDIIDEDKRGEFFGKRNRVVNLMGFVSTFIAGLVLSFFKGFDTNGNAHYVFFGFGILFFLAFLSKLISSYYKSKIYGPPYEVPKAKITFRHFLGNMTHNNYGIFVLYIFMFKLVANISAPFFALYLLRDLHMSYMYYTFIIGASILASFVTMGLWGKLIDKRGSKLVLKISGFLIPFSPLLLILGIYINDPMTRFFYILIEEMFSGAVWAAFNLSTSSFLFDATEKDERVKYIAYYNFLTGIAIFLGATLGGVLIHEYPVWIVSAIPVIFLTTGVLRFLVTTLFIRKVQEARMVEIDFPGRGFFHKVITVSPHSHSHVELMESYVDPRHAVFHNLFVSRTPKVETKTVKSSKSNNSEEKEFYEQKSFEYYKENALKTMNQKEQQCTPEDDSSKIEKNLEKDEKNISTLTENIKKEQVKKK